MKLNILPVLALSVACCLTACNSATGDEDIQQTINDKFEHDRAGAALHATVDNGVATITGECKGKGCAARIEEEIGEIKGVKSVETHIIEN